MALFTQMVHLQLTLFLLIMIGLTLKKIGIITKEGQKCLSDITVNLILPCNIISSFMGEMNVSEQFIKNCSGAFLISLGIQMFSILFGKYCFLRCPKEKGRIFTYGIIVSNSSFIGIPIIHSLYGAVGVLYILFSDTGAAYDVVVGPCPLYPCGSQGGIQKAGETSVYYRCFRRDAFDDVPGQVPGIP